MEDEIFLSCPTQDEDYEISSEVVYPFHGEELNQDLKMIFFQLGEIDIGVSPQLLLLHSLCKEIVQTTFVVLTFMCKQIFKAYLSMSVIHVKMNSFMQVTREEKSALPIVAQGKSLLISSFFKEVGTCSFSYWCSLLKLEKEFSSTRET